MKTIEQMKHDIAVQRRIANYMREHGIETVAGLPHEMQVELLTAMQDDFLDLTDPDVRAQVEEHVV